MTAQEIANAITYLRKVFVGPLEVDAFVKTMTALEREYRRLRDEERSATVSRA